MNEKMILDLKGQEVLVSYFNPENIELHFETGVIRIQNNECCWRIRNEQSIIASSIEMLLEVDKVGECFAEDELQNLIEKKHNEIDNIIVTCNKSLENSILEDIEENKCDVILKFSNNLRLDIFSTSKGAGKPYTIK